MAEADRLKRDECGFESCREYLMGQMRVVFQPVCKTGVIWQCVFDSHLAHHAPSTERAVPPKDSPPGSTPGGSTNTCPGGEMADTLRLERSS
jgi:hypothetical protein